MIFILTLSAILPGAMLIIGLININECPIDSKIPIWLIVFGCVGLFFIIIRISASIYLRRRYYKN